MPPSVLEPPTRAAEPIDITNGPARTVYHSSGLHARRIILKIDLKLPGGGEIHIEREKGKNGEVYSMLFILSIVVIGAFLLLASAGY